MIIQINTCVKDVVFIGFAWERKKHFSRGKNALFYARKTHFCLKLSNCKRETCENKKILVLCFGGRKKPLLSEENKGIDVRKTALF